MKVGVEQNDEGGKPQLSLEPLKRPITIEDLMRHTSGLTYGFYGETAGEKSYDKSDLYDGDFDNATFVERSGQDCRLPTSRERAGTTATRPMYSAASSKWYRGRRCFSSSSSGCSIRSG